MRDEEIKIVIPEVNSESGLKLCGGNIKIYIQSLLLFAKNIPATLEKMQAFISEGNVTEKSLKNYSTSVHGIKGMCDYIGAEEARKAAKKLEDIADSGDIKGVLALNGAFIEQIERIINNIQTWLAKNNFLMEHDNG